MMTPNGTADAALLDELAARSQGAAVGDRIALDDLRERDQCGPHLFNALAQRFGWKRGDDGMWLRERVPRWTPGWVQPKHEPQWVALFEAAFGYRMADQLWQWKYRHQEGLPGMGAWRDGELVAFYGGMTREVLHFGKPERALQIGDVMTRPEERGVMTRSGPFQIAAATYIERTAGYGMPTLFGYGFPTDKALKVAERLGLYKQVDQMMELSWEPAAGSSFDAARPMKTSDAATADRLWRAMAAQMRSSVVGIRDARYLDDRYAQHPLNRYECLVVHHRITRRAKGIVVVRDRGDEGGMELLDLVGPPTSWKALVRAARAWTADRGRKRAYLWTTRSHAHLLDDTAPAAREMELMVPANVWTPGPPAGELQGKWWLTGGDTDFR